MRLLSMALLFVVSFSMLVSCSDNDTDNKSQPTMKNETEFTIEEELDSYALRNIISDNLPDKDFEGAVFKVIARDREDFVTDIGTELEESGDVIEDAIYSRNSNIEERFNVNIQAVYDPNPIATTRNSVLAGDDEFDLLMAQVIELGTATIEGNYLDWYEDLPYVNLDKPWYIGNAKDALAIKEHAYMMIGEYNLSVLRFTYCMYFNKNLAEDYNVGDLYQIVNDGNWTLDQLSNTIKDIHNDINGDGVMDQSDLYGLVTDYYSAVITYQYAFDNPTMAWDADGLPVLNANTPKTVSIVEKVYDLLYTNNGAHADTWGVDGGIWEEERALFTNSLFRSAITYRDYDFDFGIIPYPKWDEHQSEYYTMSDGAHDAMAVPVTISNPEKTSIIIEALNAESYKKVIPAYYDIALKVKFTRDEASVGVLDLILDGRCFDFGYIYDGWQGVAFLLQDCISNKSADYTSKYAAKESGAINRYDTVIQGLLELEN